MGRRPEWLQNIPGQNNPERDGAATPPRPVSRGPGLACVPRIGRVPGASLSGSSLSGGKMRRGWRSIFSACGAAPGARGAVRCPRASIRWGLTRRRRSATNTTRSSGAHRRDHARRDRFRRRGRHRDPQLCRDAKPRQGRCRDRPGDTGQERSRRFGRAGDQQMSPYHGERLKGIKVAVSLTKTKRGSRSGSS